MSGSAVLDLSNDVPVGLISPGAMGASVGAVLSSLRPVLWASEGRGRASHERAEVAGLTDVNDIGSLVETAGVILSICPPGLAERVAQEAARLNFEGTYVDANAISPRTSRRLAGLFGNAVHYVDASLVGPPVAEGSSTRLYLAGRSAAHLVALFEGTALETVQLAGGVGAASALKICYGTTTKGIAGLLLAVRALANAEGIEEELLTEWERSAPQILMQAESAATHNAARAWRVVAELEEGAGAFQDVGLPGGFSVASADVMRRMTPFKDAGEVDAAEVLDQILHP